jgi:hypothetical protein
MFDDTERMISRTPEQAVGAGLDDRNVAITAKLTTQQPGYLDFAYAPPFSRTWDTLNVAGNVSK